MPSGNCNASTISPSRFSIETIAFLITKKLADSFLSQVRYERKFVIAKDQALYREFLKFKGDFERYLNEASGIADPKVAALLNQVKQDYDRYHELFDKETVQIKAHRDYPKAGTTARKPDHGQYPCADRATTSGKAAGYV